MRAGVRHGWRVAGAYIGTGTGTGTGIQLLDNDTTCWPLDILSANLAFTWAFLRRYHISCPSFNILSFFGVELLGREVGHVACKLA